MPVKLDCKITSLRLLRPVPHWGPALRVTGNDGLAPTISQSTGKQRLVAEEVSEARVIAGQGLVGDHFFGEGVEDTELAQSCLFFASAEYWGDLARRLVSVDIEQPSSMQLPRHVLTEGVDWTEFSRQPFELGDAAFQPLDPELSEKVLQQLDLQLRLPAWESWLISPGLVAVVTRSGWLKSSRPVFCGCGN